jgi:hypothetical protein
MALRRCLPLEVDSGVFLSGLLFSPTSVLLRSDHRATQLHRCSSCSSSLFFTLGVFVACKLALCKLGLSMLY